MPHDRSTYNIGTVTKTRCTSGDLCLAWTAATNCWFCLNAIPANLDNVFLGDVDIEVGEYAFGAAQRFWRRRRSDRVGELQYRLLFFR